MTADGMEVTLTHRVRKAVTTDETTWTGTDKQRSVDSYVSSSYRYRVTGAPDHTLSTWSAAKHTRRMRVDGLTVDFTNGNLRHVSLQGRRLRKDGTAITPLGDNSGSWDRAGLLARAPWVEQYLTEPEATP